MLSPDLDYFEELSAFETAKWGRPARHAAGAFISFAALSVIDALCFPSKPLWRGPLHRIHHRIVLAAKKISTLDNRRGPGDVSFEAKRFCHRPMATHQVPVGNIVAAGPG